MSAQHTPGPNWTAINPAAVATCSQRHIQSVIEDAQRDILALPFSVWRETKVMPPCKLGAFRNEVDAIAFAEHRARIEGENDADIDTTIWVPGADGAEVLHATYHAAIAKATGAAT